MSFVSKVKVKSQSCNEPSPKIDNTAVYFNSEINQSILFESESEDALVMLPSSEIDDTTVYFKQPSSLPTSVSFMLA